MPNVSRNIVAIGRYIKSFERRLQHRVRSSSAASVEQRGYHLQLLLLLNLLKGQHPKLKKIIQTEVQID